MCDARRRTAAPIGRGRINRVSRGGKDRFAAPRTEPPHREKLTMSSPSDAEVIGRSLGEPEPSG